MSGFYRPADFFLDGDASCGFSLVGVSFAIFLATLDNNPLLGSIMSNMKLDQQSCCKNDYRTHTIIIIVAPFTHIHITILILILLTTFKSTY